MRSIHHKPKLARGTVKQALALGCLLFLGGVAIAGPSGLIALGEQRRELGQRREDVARLKDERDRMRNRVELLDPRSADPDLAGELLRSELNVAHPDEMVMLLPQD
jgi:cell division protein FtsB